MRKGIVNLSAADHARFGSSGGQPQQYVWRARINLMTADGLGANAVMRGTGRAKSVVWRWQKRCIRPTNLLIAPQRVIESR